MPQNDAQNGVMALDTTGRQIGKNTLIILINNMKHRNGILFAKQDAHDGNPKRTVQP